jgi:hypothetical protein
VWSPTLAALPDVATNRVHQLATEARTGVLQIVGEPGGLIYLADGRIVHAESPATPGVEVAVLRTILADETAWEEALASLQARAGRKAALAAARQAVTRGAVPAVRLDAALQSAAADALLAMLGGYGVTVTRTRFVTGQRPWIGLGRPRTADEALAETTRRLRLLHAVGQRVRPDDDIVRSAIAGPDAAPVRLSPQQWDLVRLCPDRRTPRNLAWTVGRGVLATTIEVCGLIELGVLGTVTPRRGPGAVAAGTGTRRTVSFVEAATGMSAAGSAGTRGVAVAARGES